MIIGKLELNLQESKTFITVKGELCKLDDAKDIDKIIGYVRENHKDVVVDINQAGLLNSGLRNLLLGLYNKAKGYGGSTAIMCENYNLTEAYNLLGMERYFRLYPGRTKSRLDDTKLSMNRG
jgi:anti-anti-sigma regulatory factor